MTASSDVRAEPNLVVTWDVHAGGAFSGLGSAIPISHIFGNDERTDNWDLFSFGVNYYFVAQKWGISAIFHKKTIFGKIHNWKIWNNV